MSFGWSASDVALLAQLAWRTVQNTRKAGNEYEELAHEVFSLHVVLRRLEKEVNRPASALNKAGDSCGEEIKAIASGCRNVLEALDKILVKYNALGEKERNARKLVAKIRFGNGQVGDLGIIREKITYYTSALSLYMNMVAAGSMGRIEKQMEEAGGDLKELKGAVNTITAKLMAGSNKEGSVLTSYADDDKAVWKEFRRELVSSGFASSFLHRNKQMIKDYFEELGRRGLLDENNTEDNIDRAEFAKDDSASGSSTTSEVISEAKPELRVRQPEVTKAPSSGQQDDIQEQQEREMAEIEGRRIVEGHEILNMRCYQEISSGTLSGLDADTRPMHVQPDPQLGVIPSCIKDASLFGKRLDFLTAKEKSEWVRRRKCCLYSTKGFYARKHRFPAEIAYVASPWGSCLIHLGIDVSTLFADFEYRTHELDLDMRVPDSCKRLIDTVANPRGSHDSPFFRSKRFNYEATELMKEMLGSFYFVSKDSAQIVRHIYSGIHHDITAGAQCGILAQMGFCCVMFLKMIRYKDDFHRWLTDDHHTDIIGRIDEWVINFDTAFGKATPNFKQLIQPLGATDAGQAMRCLDMPHFHLAPCLEPGASLTSYWEESLNLIEEMHSKIKTHIYYRWLHFVSILRCVDEWRMGLLSLSRDISEMMSSLDTLEIKGPLSATLKDTLNSYLNYLLIGVKIQRGKLERKDNRQRH